MQENNNQCYPFARELVFFLCVASILNLSQTWIPQFWFITSVPQKRETNATTWDESREKTTMRIAYEASGYRPFKICNPPFLLDWALKNQHCHTIIPVYLLVDPPTPAVARGRVRETISQNQLLRILKLIFFLRAETGLGTTRFGPPDLRFCCVQKATWGTGRATKRTSLGLPC